MPFVPGFPLPVLDLFGLYGNPLSLAAISVALSPHPKIPFLADKNLRLTSGIVSSFSRLPTATGIRCL